VLHGVGATAPMAWQIIADAACNSAVRSDVQLWAAVLLTPSNWRQRKVRIAYMIVVHLEMPGFTFQKGSGERMRHRNSI